VEQKISCPIQIMTIRGTKNGLGGIKFLIPWKKKNNKRKNPPSVETKNSTQGRYQHYI
jgi:hypothetical protein